MKKNYRRNTAQTGSIDPVINSTERFPAQSAMKTAPSLKPGIAMMEACAFGQTEAVAIREAWRFSFPIKTVSREEFDSLVERNGQVVFNG
jgi:hypothetical protein